jgi:hypothetical protein
MIKFMFIEKAPHSGLVCAGTTTHSSLRHLKKKKRPGFHSEGGGGFFMESGFSQLRGRIYSSLVTTTTVRIFDSRRLQNYAEPWTKISLSPCLPTANFYRHL